MIRLLLLLILALPVVHASHVRWLSDYEKAHIQALKEQKPLMVLLVKKECEACSKVLTYTFQDQAYIPWINEDFIPVLITKDQRQSYPIEMLYTLTYPAIFFLTPQELFLSDPIFGLISPEAFQKYIETLK